MVGNIAQVISGTNFNVGFYQITSVSVGVSVTVSTNNSGASISTGVGASGVINIGGALLTLGKVTGAMLAQQTAYFTGTFTITTSITMTFLNTTGVPTTFIGFGTTRGDTGRATWTSATNSIDIVDFTAAGGFLFQNLIISSTAGTPGDGLRALTTGNTSGVRVVNCVFTGLNIAILGDFTLAWSFEALSIENTEIKNSVSHGVSNSGITWVFGSFIHDNGGAGLRAPGGAVTGGFTITDSVVYNNTGGGYVDISSVGPTTRYLVAIGSDFSTNTGAGVLIGLATNGLLMNDVFDANTTYGLSNGGAGASTNLGQWNLAFFNNTTAARNGVTAGFSDITLSANPYTSIGTNFALNSTAGGGAALKAAGFPGILNAGGTGFVDVGALQSQAAAAAGTTASGFAN